MVHPIGFNKKLVDDAAGSVHLLHMAGGEQYAMIPDLGACQFVAMLTDLMCLEGNGIITLRNW
jgi:hypothetical protein